MMARINTCPTCGAVRVVEPAPGTDRVPDILAYARQRLGMDLSGAPEDCWRFFERVFTAPTPTRVRDLAADLGVLPSTLISRFYRAELPSPKVYMKWAVILQASWMLGEPHASIARVALALGASSPQSFTRSVRLLTGLNAGPFFASHTPKAVLLEIRETLVLPHLGALQHFNPLLAAPIHVLRHEAALRTDGVR